MKVKSGIIYQSKTIIAIATSESVNAKTGSGVQIWILDARMHPVESRRGGHDAENQCKGCPLASENGCYVNANPLSAIWRKYTAGGYSMLRLGSPEFDSLFAGQYVRFGAYGNPSALPILLIEYIAGLASRFTGYFHDWHQMPASKARAYGRFLMASCETSNWQQAQALGLRTFTTCSDPVDIKGAGMECLADAKGMQCKECGLCDGTARARKLPSVWIRVHGYQVKKASIATNSPAKLETV